MESVNFLLLLILFTVVFFIAGVISTFSCKCADNLKCSCGKINQGTFFAIMLIVTMIFLLLTSVILSSSSPTNIIIKGNDIPESTITIYAMSDDSQVNGRFSGGRFTSRGYINEVEYIKFIVNNGKGGKEIRKVTAGKSSFYETDSQPCIVTYYITEEKWWWFIKNTSKYRVYEFYVPKGSLTNEFLIDLE